MASHPSRDELRSELRRQRLPRAYITRLLAELDDHYEDLLEERSTSMGAARKLQVPQNGQDDLQQRLGEPAQLALFAAEQYHSRSFWGRHLVLTFVISPLPLLCLLWIAAATGLVWFGSGLAYVCEHWLGLSQYAYQSQDYPGVQVAAMVFFSWLIIVFPPLTAAALLCRTARRNAVNWRWPIVACTLLALVLGFLAVSYRVAITQNDGRLMIGVDAHSSVRWLLLTYLPKFATALGVGLLLVKRAQNQLRLEASTTGYDS